MRPKVRQRLATAALLTFGAALWTSSFAGVFQYDDFGAIVGAGALNGGPSLAESASSIRPLTRLTFFAERRLFGLEPAGYHLLSVALHLASSLLVWRIGRRLVPRASGEAAGRSSPIAFAAAALFLVHPLATEAVTYLSGRASLLAACLSLLAVERWQSWREQPAATSGIRRLPWGSLAAFALAFVAKETAAIVPLALLLVDSAIGGERAHASRVDRLRLYLPHLLVLTLFFALAASQPVYRRLLAHSLALRAPVENLALQPRMALQALALFVQPLRLNLDHDLRPDSVPAGGLPVAQALTLGALTVWAVLALRRRSPIGFGWLWFLVHLLPTCSFVARNDLLSERNLYLPAVGLCFATAGLGADALRRSTGLLPRAVALSAGLALLAALATLTVRRNALYADPVALWSDTVRKSPAKARPHANLGWSLYIAGELDAAIEEYRIALRLEPDDAVTRENLPRAWERKHRAATEGPVRHLNAPRTPAAE